MTIDSAVAPATIEADRLRDLLSSFPLFTTHTRENGEEYADTGRVVSCAIENGRIHAEVMGTQVYETEWHWYDGEWDCACSCPVEVYCKHAYAVALRVLAEAAAAGFEDSRLADVLRLGDAPADGKPDGEGDDDWDTSKSPFTALREAREVWQRESALDQLLSDAPVLVSPYAPGFVEILEEADPDLLCWRLAQKIAREAEGWVPDDLEPFRDREDLALRFSGRERESLADELLAWAAERRMVPRRRLRLGFSLQPVTDVSARLVFEVQATTARLTNAARNPQQLQQIRAEQRREADSLLPEHAALLEWVLANAVPASAPAGDLFSTSRGGALLDWVGGRPELALWSADLDPTLASRFGIEVGKPLQLERRPLRVVPKVAPRGEGLVVSLGLAWADGEELPIGHGVLFIEPLDAADGLVLVNGVLHPLSEAPPSGLLEGFASVRELSLEGEGRARALNVLTSRFPSVATTLSAKTRVYPAVPIVAFDLRDDDWLHARLFACRRGDRWQPGEPVRDDVKAFEWSADAGWIPLESSAAPTEEADYGAVEGRLPDTSAAPTADADANADIWLELPNPEDVTPAVEWLESIPMLPRSMEPDAPVESGDDGWWMRVNQRRMNDFAESWGERPDSARFVGTRSVRQLLGATRRVRPRMRIRKSGIDWFSVSAELEAEGQRLTPEQMQLLRRSSARFVKLGSEWVSKDAIAGYDQSSSLLADLGLDADSDEQRVSIWQLAGASPETLRELEEMGTDAETVAAIGELKERIATFDGLPEVDAGGLSGTLRDYQRHGLSFLVHTSSLGLGPVLADDMGLGKTLQALAWLQHLVDEEPNAGPTLVVCPASVVHVWKREAARFTPKLNVLVLGRGRDRFKQWDEIAGADLVVTNYALLRRDVARWREVDLRAYVLDEAQNIKNPDTAVAKAARSLQARNRLALTGTPLENRPLDVWSIVSCLNPGYLGSRNEFQDRFGNPEHPESAYRLLSAKLRPILLRRTKDQVAPELPERIEERLECELTQGQRQLYMTELRRSREKVIDMAEDDPELSRNRVAVLAVLTRLRQICCHPALVGGDAEIGSGKFDTVLGLLDSLLAEGHKVLLFSQFVECLKLLASAFDERSMKYHMLTGATRNREEIVSDFQEGSDPSVFLISLKAGGTGLNLTSASYVVLFDPWWNPAVEAQAIDRTHRIGQKRTVIAYRMATRGTIEEKIWELQQRKAKMLKDVLSEQGFAGSLTREDLAYILEDPE